MTRADRVKGVREYIGLPLLYNHWYVAGMVEEFTRRPIAKTLLVRSIVFYRIESGELTALQNRCLHRSFPLAESTVDGDDIVCGYHGIRYRPDGAIARVPCQLSVPNRSLRAYPVREIGPFVFIWMGDQDTPDTDKLPDLPFLSDPGYRTMLGATDFAGSYLLMHENLNDLTHFAYLHRETFRFDDSFFDLPTTVEQRPEGIYCNRIDDDPRRATGALPPQIRERARGKPAERWDGGMVVSPGVFQGYAPIFVGDPQSDDREVFKAHIMHFLTPETPSSTHYWWSVSNNFALDDDAHYTFMQAHLEKGFEEDRWAVGQMQRLLEIDETPYSELSVQGDKAGLLFRRRVVDWVNDEYGASEQAMPAPTQSHD